MTPGFVPPQPQMRQNGPGCWAIGAIRCMVVLLLGAVLFFTAVGKFMNSSAGKELKKQLTSTMQGVKEQVVCVQNFEEVHAALKRYVDKNGKYPKSLTELVPDYLTDSNKCHCELDPNPDPKHVTFVYTPPTPTSKPDDRVLSFTADQKITIQNQTQVMSTEYYYTVAGKEMVQQSQTDPTGKTTVTPAHEKKDTGQ